MRDLAFFLFFVLMMVFVLKKPFVGIALWAWTSFIVPPFLLYGFAAGLRYNFITVLVTVFSYLVSREKSKIIIDGLAVLVILLFFHTSISALFAEYNSPQLFQQWEGALRAIILFIFILLIVRKRNHLELLCWAIMLSIGFYGFVEGLKFIASAGGHKIIGPGNSVLGDNNHLALALNMVLPIALYIFKQEDNKYLKYLALIFMFTSTLAVVGTYSRGGLLGLIVLGTYFGLNSDRKFVYMIAVSIAVATVLVLAPEEWFNRIDTIDEADQDRSFIGRVIAWKQSILIAMDNPILGGGLHGVQTTELWLRYGQHFDRLDFLIETPHALEISFKAAHSIYFQVLGDLGFFGLFIYLLILFLAIRKAKKISIAKLDSEDRWINDLAAMIRLSLIVFSICGALLSMAYFELYYILLAMIIVINRLEMRASKIERRSDGP